MLADYAPPLIAPREGLRRIRRSVLIGGVVATAAALALGEVAYGVGRTGPDTVLVHRGDTLWGIAASRYPQDNLADRVQEIISLNRKTSPAVDPGEVLQLPAS